MADMQDLIARLEQAEGPSRDLDAEMAIAAKVPPEGAWLLKPPAPPATFATGGYSFWDCPAYTASIDAALSLVPGGLLRSMIDWLGNAVCNLRTGSILDPATVEWTGGSKTLALAICIAALRARAA